MMVKFIGLVIVIGVSIAYPPIGFVLLFLLGLALMSN